MPLPYRKNPAPSPFPFADTPLAQQKQFFFQPTINREKAERERERAQLG
jgi:hypothetical protein